LLERSLVSLASRLLVGKYLIDDAVALGKLIELVKLIIGILTSVFG
jgi:hypothetical protein